MSKQDEKQKLINKKDNLYNKMDNGLEYAVGDEAANILGIDKRLDEIK